MKHDDWEFELFRVVIEEFESLENRFAHVQTQKGNHQSILENCLDKLVILS